MKTLEHKFSWIKQDGSTTECLCRFYTYDPAKDIIDVAVDKKQKNGTTDQKEIKRVFIEERRLFFVGNLDLNQLNSAIEAEKAKINVPKDP